MSTPNRDVRTVVEAVDRLTTQVRRLADAHATPVVDVSPGVAVVRGRPVDAPTTTADDAVTTASLSLRDRIGMAIEDAPFRPELRRAWQQADAVLAALSAWTTEDAQRSTRRERLHNLLARADRSTLTSGEVAALRDLIDAEVRGADTARAVAAGNKRHVQLLVPELEQAQAALERVRAQATVQRARGESGSTDHKIGLYDAAVAILAALDGAEQPTTEEPQTPDTATTKTGH